MPGDNAAPVAAGVAVAFPRQGPNTTSGGISSVLSGQGFNLATVGTYQVDFNVGVTEAEQLMVVLDAGENGVTVSGRATDRGDQIVGTYLVKTSTPNTILSIRVPLGNTPAATITPFDGDAATIVSAHLVITRIE